MAKVAKARGRAAREPLSRALVERQSSVLDATRHLEGGGPQDGSGARLTGERERRIPSRFARGLLRCAGSEQSSFRNAHDARPRDHEVVEDLNVHQG